MIHNHDSQYRYYVSHEGDCYAVYSRQAILRLSPNEYDLIKWFDTLDEAKQYARECNERDFGTYPNYDWRIILS